MPCRGVGAVYLLDAPVAQAEALRRYPDPKEPTVVKIANGGEYKFVNGQLVFRHPKNPWVSAGLTIAECLALGEIAQEAQQEQSHSASHSPETV